MTPNENNTASYELALPSHWAAEFEPQLATNEKPQAYVEIDLDTRLQFTDGVVIVTNQRLLAKAPGEKSWQQWPLRAGLVLNHFDHAGAACSN